MANPRKFIRRDRKRFSRIFIDKWKHRKWEDCKWETQCKECRAKYRDEKLERAYSSNPDSSPLGSLLDSKGLLESCQGWWTRLVYIFATIQPARRAGNLLPPFKKKNTLNMLTKLPAPTCIFRSLKYVSYLTLFLKSYIQIPIYIPLSKIWCQTTTQGYKLFLQL